MCSVGHNHGRAVRFFRVGVSNPPIGDRGGSWPPVLTEDRAAELPFRRPAVCSAYSRIGRAEAQGWIPVFDLSQFPAQARRVSISLSHSLFAEASSFLSPPRGGLGWVTLLLITTHSEAQHKRPGPGWVTPSAPVHSFGCAPPVFFVLDRPVKNGTHRRDRDLVALASVTKCKNAHCPKLWINALGFSNGPAKSGQSYRPMYYSTWGTWNPLPI